MGSIKKLVHTRVMLTDSPWAYQTKGEEFAQSIVQKNLPSEEYGMQANEKLTFLAQNQGELSLFLETLSVLLGQIQCAKTVQSISVSNYNMEQQIINQITNHVKMGSNYVFQGNIQAVIQQILNQKLFRNQETIESAVTTIQRELKKNAKATIIQRQLNQNSKLSIFQMQTKQKLVWNMKQSLNGNMEAVIHKLWHQNLSESKETHTSFATEHFEENYRFIEKKIPSVLKNRLLSEINNTFMYFRKKGQNKPLSAYNFQNMQWKQDAASLLETEIESEKFTAFWQKRFSTEHSTELQRIMEIDREYSYHFSVKDTAEEIYQNQQVFSKILMPSNEMKYKMPLIRDLKIVTGNLHTLLFAQSRANFAFANEQNNKYSRNSTLQNYNQWNTAIKQSQFQQTDSASYHQENLYFTKKSDWYLQSKTDNFQLVQNKRQYKQNNDYGRIIKSLLLRNHRIQFENNICMKIAEKEKPLHFQSTYLQSIANENFYKNEKQTVYGDMAEYFYSQMNGLSYIAQYNALQQSDKQSNIQSNIQSNKQSNIQSNIQSNKQSNKQSKKKSNINMKFLDQHKNVSFFTEIFKEVHQQNVKQYNKQGFYTVQENNNSHLANLNIKTNAAFINYIQKVNKQQQNRMEKHYYDIQYDLQKAFVNNKNLWNILPLRVGQALFLNQEQYWHNINNVYLENKKYNSTHMDFKQRTSLAETNLFFDMHRNSRQLLNKIRYPWFARHQQYGKGEQQVQWQRERPMQHGTPKIQPRSVLQNWMIHNNKQYLLNFHKSINTIFQNVQQGEGSQIQNLAYHSPLSVKILGNRQLAQSQLNHELQESFLQYENGSDSRDPIVNMSLIQPLEIVIKNSLSHYEKIIGNFQGYVNLPSTMYLLKKYISNQNDFAANGFAENTIFNAITNTVYHSKQVYYNDIEYHKEQVLKYIPSIHKLLERTYKNTVLQNREKVAKQYQREATFHNQESTSLFKRVDSIYPMTNKLHTNSMAGKAEIYLQELNSIYSAALLKKSIKYPLSQIFNKDTEYHSEEVLKYIPSIHKLLERTYKNTVLQNREKMEKQYQREATFHNQESTSLFKRVDSIYSMTNKLHTNSMAGKAEIYLQELNSIYSATLLKKSIKYPLSQIFNKNTEYHSEEVLKYIPSIHKLLERTYKNTVLQNRQKVAKQYQREATFHNQESTSLFKRVDSIYQMTNRVHTNRLIEKNTKHLQALASMHTVAYLEKPKNIATKKQWKNQESYSLANAKRMHTKVYNTSEMTFYDKASQGVAAMAEEQLQASQTRLVAQAEIIYKLEQNTKMQTQSHIELVTETFLEEKQKLWKETLFSEIESKVTATAERMIKNKQSLLRNDDSDGETERQSRVSVASAISQGEFDSLYERIYDKMERAIWSERRRMGQ